MLIKQMGVAQHELITREKKAKRLFQCLSSKWGLRNECIMYALYTETVKVSMLIKQMGVAQLDM